ncbi:hypothetical protein JK161_00250 [Leuconostoc mesenteroides]|uniref:hypothetical protein n=1 Tax=Leuconostoc mesenteroides TaxID=1245 RepID=UPI001B8B29B1|nr:hypothetical protein [Leuconostoc mesenteroides]MBS0941275.1 hypothetical protein [Leuconostoc mesenteroides]
MASFFLLIFCVTIIWFFVSRRSDKKTKGKTATKTWCILVISIISFIIVGNSSSGKDDSKYGSATTTNFASSSNKPDLSVEKKLNSSTSSSTEVSSSSSSSSIKASQQYDFSKVEYGMTMDQVINAVGKQPTNRDNYALFYDDDDFDFTNDKLIGSSVQSVQNKIDAKNRAEEKSAKKEQEDQEQLKSQAKYFGNRSVEYVQNHPAAYSSAQIENGMRYVYFVKKNSYLVRIDTNDGYTSVYSYDGNSQNQLGNTLYVGKTILNQPAKKYYYYYGK